MNNPVKLATQNTRRKKSQATPSPKNKQQKNKKHTHRKPKMGVNPDYREG
jgi:hypothetical protein